MTTAVHPSVAGSQQFRAADRIRSSRDFARVRAHGSRAATEHYAIEAVASDTRSRLGLVVSRRVGNAVLRNRTKRLIREWFRRERVEFEDTFDLVVIARSGAAELSAPDAWRELRDAVRRAMR